MAFGDEEEEYVPQAEPEKVVVATPAAEK